MGELEDANLEHTVLSDYAITENTTEGTAIINEISAKDDSKARRIIYKHLNEETWEIVEDIDTAYDLWKCLKAYYCETDEEKMNNFKKYFDELQYNGEELRIFIAHFENLWNKYSKAVDKLEPLSSKNKKSEKLSYLRNSFKKSYPDVYEGLTYAVIREEDISVIKKIIELTLKDKQTNNINTSKPKFTNHPFNAQPVYKKKCLLCGSTDHIINQCSMRDSFYNWKKIEQSKLSSKRTGKRGNDRSVLHEKRKRNKICFIINKFY